MRNSRNTVHRNFDWNRDLLLHLLRGDSRPLCNHIDVVVSYIRVGFNRQAMERNHAPSKQQNGNRQHKKAVLQRKVDQLPDHRASSVASICRALATTCLPGSIPETSSCLFPSSILPAFTAIRLNCLSPAGTKTHSRSCRCRMAVAGTTAWTSFVLLSSVAVTNIPSLSRPGLATSMRTLAVRMLGSSTGPISLMRPTSTLSGYAFSLTCADWP